MSDETGPLYVIEHTANGDVPRSYDGMTKETVAALLSESGNAFDFVDKALYDSGLAALQPAI
jgi:hypothetical protein